jgi:hypothetical protein
MLRLPKSVIALLVLAASLVQSPTGPRANTQCPEQAVYALVRQFLLAAYPSIPIPQSTLRISASVPIVQPSLTFGDVSADLTGPVYYNPRVVNGKHTYQVEWTTLLDAQFQLSSGRIQQVWVGGRWVNSDKRNLLVKTLSSHPEWTNAQGIEALRSADAKYTPDKKQAFMNQIPLKTLSDALGMKLSIRSVEFNVSPDKRLADYSVLNWSVEFRAGSETVGASFEPFDGRLITLIVGSPLMERKTSQ